MRPIIREAKVHDLLYDERLKLAIKQSKRIEQDLRNAHIKVFTVKLFEAVSAVVCVLIMSFVFFGWWHGN